MCDSHRMVAPDYLDEEIRMPDRGDYMGTILGFGEASQSSRGPYFFLPVRVKIEGVGTYIEGYPCFLPTLRMLKASEAFYKDKRVGVSINHRTHSDRTYVDLKIKWDTLCP